MGGMCGPGTYIDIRHWPEMDYTLAWLLLFQCIAQDECSHNKRHQIISVDRFSSKVNIWPVETESSKAPRVRISSQFSIFSAYIHTNNYISLCTIHRTDTKVWFWSSMCTHTISFIKVQFILQIYIFDISFLCDLIQE